MMYMYYLAVDDGLRMMDGTSVDGLISRFEDEFGNKPTQVYGVYRGLADGQVEAYEVWPNWSPKHHVFWDSRKKKDFEPLRLRADDFMLPVSSNHPHGMPHSGRTEVTPHIPNLNKVKQKRRRRQRTKRSR